MRAVLLLLLGLGMATLCSPARAWDTGVWEAAACVQRQLNALGRGPLEVDGRIGPATRAALARYEAVFGALPARPLSSMTAIVHCRQLGLRHYGAYKLWPAKEEPFRILSQDGVPDRHRASAQRVMADSLVFLKDRLGLELAGAPVVILGNDPKAIRRLAAPFLAPGFSDAGLARSLKRTCAGPELNGLSLPGLILICYPGDDGWKARPLWTELALVLLHELVHEAQWQLAGLFAATSEAQILARHGPIWLAEGSAVAVTDDYQSIDTKAWYLVKIAKLPPETSRDLRKAERWSAGKSLDGAIYLLGGGAALQLATRATGPVVFVRFYEALGEGKDWPEAFEAVFGLSREGFYDKWDALMQRP